MHSILKSLRGWGQLEAHPRTGGNKARRRAFEELEQRSLMSSVPVIPGVDTLRQAVNQAKAGDTLVLKPGLFQVSDTILIKKNLTIRGESTNAAKVNIVPVLEDYRGPGTGFEGLHLFEVHDTVLKNKVQSVTFANFTVQGAPEEGKFGPSGDFGPDDAADGIHLEYVEYVTINNVQSNLNSGDGIFIVGAISAKLDRIVAIHNGGFGVDVDSALELIVDHSTFTGNGISGLEAAGHLTANIQFAATVSIKHTVAMGNGEIGIEVERFKLATFDHITCSYNLSDGFDADRVYLVKIAHSTFANNLGDGIELFPIDVPVFPADFPFNIVVKLYKVTIFGNLEGSINHPKTED